MDLTTLYLTLYNTMQFVGWSVVLYTQNLDYLCVFQTIQLIEVLHCMVGFVKSSAIQTFLQIASRIIIVWIALIPYEEARLSIGYPMVLIAWPIAETTRYLYYTINLCKLNIYLVTWMRYSFFIVLYPFGVTGELLISWQLKQILADKKTLDYALPNSLNFSIYGSYLVAMFMLSYIPFFPQLYMYMMSQRKKFLGGESKAAIKSKAQTDQGQRQKSY